MMSTLWPHLEPELDSGASRQEFSLLTHAGSFSLLSAKVARSFPASTVVTHHSLRGSAVSDHLDLLKLTGTGNNLLTAAGPLSASASGSGAGGLLSAGRRRSILATGDVFRYQVVGPALWSSLALQAASGSGQEFTAALERAAGETLALSSTSFLVLPRWSAWLHSVAATDGSAAAADDRWAAGVRSWVGRGIGGADLHGWRLGGVGASVAAAEASPNSNVGGSWEEAGSESLAGLAEQLAAADRALGRQRERQAAAEAAKDASAIPSRYHAAAAAGGAADLAEVAEALGSLETGASATDELDEEAAWTWFGAAASSRVAALVDRYDPAHANTAPASTALDSPRPAGSLRGGDLATGHPAAPWRWLLARAAAAAGFDSASVRFSRLPAVQGGPDLLLARVDLAPWAAAHVADAGSLSLPRARVSAHAPWWDKGTAADALGSTFGFDAAGTLPLPGVSLHTLLSLGLVPEQRAEVMRMFLALPLPAMAAAARAGGLHVATADAAKPEGGSSAGGSAAEWSVAPWLIRFRPAGTGAAAELALSADEPEALDAERALDDSGGAGGGGGGGDPAAAEAGAGAGASGEAELRQAAARVEAAARRAARLATLLAGHLEAVVPTEVTPGKAVTVGKRQQAGRPEVVAGVVFSSAGWSSSLAGEELGGVGDAAWAAIRAELEGHPEDTASGGAPGAFSAIEVFSGAGSLSTRLAAAFPAATVVSVEGDRDLSDLHFAAALRRNLRNNAICRRAVDADTLKALYRSPEFLRYMIVSRDVAELLRTEGRGNTGQILGYASSVAMTSFVRVPSSALLSLAFTTVFGTYPDPRALAPAAAWAHSDTRPVAGASGALTGALGMAGPLGLGDLARFAVGSGRATNSRFRSRFQVQHHPRPTLRSAEARILSQLAKTPAGKTRLVASPLLADAEPGTALSSGIVRIDLLELERQVRHHFESEIDGHDRTYTMRVSVNGTAAAAHRDAMRAAVGRRGNGEAHQAAVAALPPGNHPNAQSVVSVGLTRDHDSAAIPYVTVHGVTLISALRLGLLAPLRARAYHAFVSLPLYLDMAPWNIVFLGPKLDYIDFDTRDRTYDHLVAHAYEVMEVLFNYKRTVEDLKKCGEKTSAGAYGFSHIADCVKSTFNGKCRDSGFPVPCGDGTCHSEYVSCLRAMSVLDQLRNHAELADKAPERQEALRGGSAREQSAAGGALRPPGARLPVMAALAGQGGGAGPAREAGVDWLGGGAWSFDKDGFRAGAVDGAGRQRRPEDRIDPALLRAGQAEEKEPAEKEAARQVLSRRAGWPVGEVKELRREERQRLGLPGPGEFPGGA